MPDTDPPSPKCRRPLTVTEKMERLANYVCAADRASPEQIARVRAKLRDLQTDPRPEQSGTGERSAE